jgi:CO/xanthine dehydrogenase FAD-binding subunit
VHFAGDAGTQVRPLEELYTGIGLKSVSLPQGSLITRVEVPPAGEVRTWFRKLRPRKSLDFTNLTLALSYAPATGRLKVAISGADMGPVVFETDDLSDAEGFIKSVAKKCRMVENLFYRRVYRKQMVGVFLRQGLEEVGAV